MWISSASIENFKSFADSGEIAFGRGMNVVVGQNDVGKSALLQALSLQFGCSPHRSALTVPSPHVRPKPNSRIRLQIRVDGPELQTLLSVHENCHVAAIHTDGADGGHARLLGMLDHGAEIEGEWLNGSQVTQPWFPGQDTLRSGLFSNFANPAHPTSFDPAPLGLSNSMSGPSIPAIISEAFRSSLFFVHAERMNVGSCALGEGVHQLLPGARNLPAVLNRLLSGDPKKARILLDHVQRVFPHIAEITASPDTNGMVTIQVWRNDIGAREDLSVPLSESGTGLSQVLSILTVVFTSTSARTILIDEPQSFLHPGAVRCLFEILREQDAHQFIVSTHLPSVVSASASTRVLSVVRRSGSSHVEEISVDNRNQMSELLSQTGTSISDVFGAEAVLWVEGRTEEACLPLIARAFGLALGGLRVVPVRSTDDHVKPDLEHLMRAYQSLVSSPSLLPIRFAFLFDRERRNDAKCESLTRASGGRLFWLKRRMFENYLLDAPAIASVLAQDLGLDQVPILASIQEWLRTRGRQAKYFDCAPSDIPPAESVNWYQLVDGAALLKDLFDDVSHHAVCYRKVKHGIALTTQLLAQSRDAFSEVASAIESTGTIASRTTRA